MVYHGIMGFRMSRPSDTRHQLVHVAILMIFPWTSTATSRQILMLTLLPHTIWILSPMLRSRHAIRVG